MEHYSKEIEEQVISLIRELMRETGHQFIYRAIAKNTTLHTLGIDSLGRSELFLRLEKHFQIHLSDHALARIESIDDIVQAIVQAILQADSSRSLQDIKKFVANNVLYSARQSVDWFNAETLLEIISLYADRIPDQPHIFFHDENGQEVVLTYAALLEQALKVAAGLKKLNLEEGDTVAIMQPTSLEFFYIFLGVLLSGGIPVPIYPPTRPHQIEEYIQHEAKILKNADIKILITFEEAKILSDLIHDLIPNIKKTVTVKALLKHEKLANPFSAKKEHYALIQYTSGSTSDPKGVLLTHDNLLSNIKAYGAAIKITSSDIAVSWLPLYHDLGLIGMWMGSLCFGIPLVLLSPLAFLNHPEKWLWAIHHYKGTISAGPNFSYELCARKIDPGSIEGLDLSSWRLAINGAEMVLSSTLKKFIDKFSAYGFRSEALTPVYGLAESSVGLTASSVDTLYTVDRIDRHTFEKESYALKTTATDKNAILEFVSCGKALPHHQIRVVNEFNKELSDRHVGHLQFQGPSSLQCYYNNEEATQAIFCEGWCNTGDLAYKVNDEIYIAGRKKDLIIKAGRNFYPSQIEELASQVAGLKAGSVIAFSVEDSEKGTERLVIVAETKTRKINQPDKIIQQISQLILTCLDVLPDDIQLVPPRTIPKTSSGKLQRALCKKNYLAGKLFTHKKPLWLLQSTLIMRFGVNKIRNLFSTIFNLLYTLYFGFIFAIFILTTWMLSFILSKPLFEKMFKMALRILITASFCPVHISGKKYIKLAPSLVYVANHTSYIDSLLLMSLLPANTYFVGKKELLRVPILRRFISKLNYIAVDRLDFNSSLDETKKMIALLTAGHSLFIFPEGTFTSSSGLRPFKLGAFKIAQETHIAVCPIAIKGARKMLNRYSLMLNPGKIEVTIAEPIDVHHAENEWEAVIHVKNTVRELIAKYCGEKTLDLISAGPFKVKNKP